MTAEVRIQLRRDLANNWQGINPVLAEGEMGIETDTRKFKFGDGITAWNKLAYASGVFEEDVPTEVSQLRNDSNYVTETSLSKKGFVKTNVVGDLTTLETITQSSLVAAINELLTRIESLEAKVSKNKP